MEKRSEDEARVNQSPGENNKNDKKRLQENIKSWGKMEIAKALRGTSVVFRPADWGWYSVVFEGLVAESRAPMCDRANGLR